MACGAGYPGRDGILDLAVATTTAGGYDPHYFETLPLVEDRHYWFVARRRVVLAGLQRHVPDWRERPLFDIGCGSAGLLAFLGRSGVTVAGACDAHLEGLRIARGRLAAPLARVDDDAPPPLRPGQSMVSLFDVLEHIDDDEGTLRWLNGILAPGGVLVLTVPAHPFLFDEADVLAHHHRRYTRAVLGKRLAAAGFETLHLGHFMASLVPAMVVSRWLGRRFSRREASARRDAELRVTPGVNGVLGAVLAVERQIARLVPPPFGGSLLAIARRPSGPGV